ncbi:restriction endonuclease subunit S [Nostoc sp.]|uniref:restriction endonuclease subunit S n=1 Tax=Nostoc sp. TaxID=1180 RepID=UPI002FF828EB
MNQWENVKLKEILRHQKGNARFLQIDESTEYKLCRVQVHRKGVVLRKKQFGHEIKTKKQQLCYAGDLIVAEMDAKFGGYGFITHDLEGSIVSSHYYLYELDYSKVTQEYLEVLINTDYIQNQIEAKGSTNYSSIRAWEFLEYTIPLPSIELQKSISKKFRSFSDFKNELIVELQKQEKYISQLKQAILQEAIAGQLTAEWRDRNPMQKVNPDTDAAALLAKIKAEKQQAIADGKLKKEKPIPEISPDEIPFYLPDSWVWCRFGAFATFERGRFSIRPRNDKSCYGGQYPFIQINSLSRNGDVITEYKQTLNEKGRSVSKEFPKGTLIIAIVGGTIGNLGVLGIDMCFPDSMVGVKPSSIRNQDFTLLLLRFKQPEIKKAAYQMAGQPNIKIPTLTDLIIPLPPLAEQKVIVEKVDYLMKIIDQLEEQIKHRKQLAEDLMQTVLREAFE